MSARLVNVRLDEERLRKARKLREEGVTLSDLVREAIDKRFEEIDKAAQPLGTAAIVERIFDRYPDPPELPPRDYEVADARAARNAIVRKLQRGEP